MTAVVELPMATRADTLSIPTSALSSRGESAVAWLPDEHGHPAPVLVRVGVANAAFTEIEGSGVVAGRVVITDRAPSTCLVSRAGDHGQ
jgi:hypothetical protein